MLRGRVSSGGAKIALPRHIAAASPGAAANQGKPFSFAISVHQGRGAPPKRHRGVVARVKAELARALHLYVASSPAAVRVSLGIAAARIIPAFEKPLLVLDRAQECGVGRGDKGGLCNRDRQTLETIVGAGNLSLRRGIDLRHITQMQQRREGEGEVSSGGAGFEGLGAVQTC